ncbi:secretion system protein E [candidate division WWE3 bacterium CG_4_9_14_0_2_um_filter_35_11]|uniref:Secretion system protein E n=1 Tax=candidate division WWE3 bacterium CG_4_9_14_0_2_um_filter_35_11 TaxID=1975077 RepID=A0A2M8EMU9_UNCKA|nr:MAG: secretion system protein E [candidate division WWE3 bacterium CG10_big_fil_rev_8_21_14_0_10_35_32]PJC24007.1 MAG: secretion system protein E [candidate division WWE3 bacterium CG_4_9_14_0_2_um_filter_35_11]
MSTNTAQTLEDLLLADGLISKHQYEEIKNEKLRSDKLTKQIILENQYIDETQLAMESSKLEGIPFIDPLNLSIPPETVQSIPEEMAKKYTIIPIEKNENTLGIAMADPQDLLIIQFLERSLKLKIKPYTSTRSAILGAIDREYSKSLGKDVNKAIEQATETSTKKMTESLQNIDQAKQIIKVSPVAQIVSVIIEYAVKSGASDIHIEPFETGTRIRYRIDGILQEKFPLPKEIHNSVVARIKILANMPIDERRKPLDGKFRVIFGDSKTDLRVSTLPTIFGEKVVIRLLKDQKAVYTLKGLGIWGNAHNVFNKALKQTTGIILVTGPTGSGKTVTLATALYKVNSIKVNIITLEDPVEINIPGVNQVQINIKADLTFANGLRSILRQDPNIIMVGEIRDGETARLAIQAALTGHLVLATLHTNSAAGAIPRLTDMGIESFFLASTINAVLAQRLVRKICENCKEEYEPEENIKKDIQETLGEKLIKIGQGHNPFSDVYTDEDVPINNQIQKETQAEFDINKLKLYRGKGCEKCNQTGYKGRIGIYEVLEVNNEIQKLAENNAITDDIEKHAKDNGMITLVQDGYLKALWGITTIDEVHTVADE